MARRADIRGAAPREINSPVRRSRQQLGALSNRTGQVSFGSEAMSRFESEAAPRQDLFVPTAYAVSDEQPIRTVIAEPVAPSTDQDVPMPPRPSAPSATEVMSSESSSRRDAVQSEFDDSHLYESSSEVPSSPTGTYSMHSRGISSIDTADPLTGAFGGHNQANRDERLVGTREWSRHHQASSRFTESSMGQGDAEHPWTGPRDDADYDGGYDGAVEHEPLPPAFPNYGKEKSNRSVMSHDLDGFSEYDAAPVTQREFSGGAAAAAMEADKINHVASQKKKVGNGGAKEAHVIRGGGAGGSGSKMKRPFLAPRLPEPDAAANDRPHNSEGETKEGSSSAYSKSGGQGGVEDPSRSTRSEDDHALWRQQQQQQQQRRRMDAAHREEYAVVRPHVVVFTPLMFIVCGILLLYEFQLNGWEVEPFSENPSVGPSVEILIEAGAKRTDLIVEDGDWWRIFSPMFLHAGVVHFAFNMLGFLQVGTMVEKVFGWWKVALIYLVGGVFGTIVSAIFVPLQVMVGASGAIFAVFGALWADLWQNWSVYQDKCQALTMLLFLTVFNVLLGMMPYLDNFAHIGGIIMGFFMGLGLLVQKREDVYGSRLDTRCYQRTLQLTSAVAVPTLLILALSLLYGRADPDEWCGWCENISCVEFPPGDSPWWACDDCTSIGFEAQYFENGTTVITCPDTSTVLTESCGGTSIAELTDCCNEVCV